MRMVHLAALGLAALCGAPRAQDQDELAAVAGRVVDAGGEPVAGVQVAAFWSFSEGKPSAYRAATTAADGTFSGQLVRRLPEMLLAYTDDGARAGSAVVPEGGGDGGLEIVLHPTVRVHGKLVSEKLGRPIPWTNVYVWSADRKYRPVSCSSHEAAFDLLLPPGAYLLDAYGTDVRGIRKRLRVDGAERDVALGDLELPATFLALMRGKQLPEWNVTAARNAVNDLPELADYRGKYLLVEAWGFW